MTDQQLLAEFEALAADEKIILALLALIGEATGRTAILDLLNKAGVRDARGFMFNVNTLDEPLLKLERLAFVSVLTARGYMCNTKLRWPAIRAAIGAHVLGDLCAAHDALHPMRQGWNGAPEPRSYRQGVARLRMALLRGQAPQQVLPLLQACMACYEAAQLHPIVDIFTRPFEPGMLILVHPLLLDDVLMLLLQHCQREPSLAPGVRGFTERHCQRRIAKNEYISDALRLALAEDAILCGELKQGATWLEGMDGSLAQFFRSVIVLLRGDSENALDKSLAGFEGALKTLRRDTGKRKMLFRGMGGHLYVLALLRSADPKMQKAAESYLELAVHTQANPDSTVYQQLSMLRQIRAGTMQTDVVLSRAWETGMQPQMFQALLWFWLSLPQLGDKREPLHALAQQAETLGYKFIAAQAASLLGHLGDADMATHAAALRERLGFADLTGWFERQEAWQRQLTALINLQQAAPDAAGGETRLVWMITYDPRHGVTEIEPREQKRDARGAWGKGRPLALKRLREDAAQMEFLTPQDIRISSTIAPSRQAYSSGLRYDIDHEQAALALVGHPHVYWLEAPDTRVELLPGAPELMIRADAGQLRLTLQPALDDINAGVVVVRETPTRLRVVSIEEEHRRIAAIVGDGLSVPLHAEKQVLEAIGAVSSLVTVQSDIGGSAGNAEQVEADTRLHVHLFPYQQGLKMQIQVRPLAGGAYYAPGSGAESMIAEVEGKQVQARRHLAGERDAERVLVSKCPVLEQAEQDHGEWLLGQPALCLQLLSELQELPPEQVVVAWPEGERFRVTRKVGGGQFRLKIRGEKDWFAASGELRVDEGRVMDLRSLLELMQATKDRFVALGDNQYLALTEELHRRLRELQAFGVESADGVRIHPLATFALEELAGEAGAVEADPAWVAHLARLEASTAFTPQLPSTLQAELRDYQRDGYDWLSRLAHWGVGACLADDMGLGKTLQALALILSRAPQGPALVIAPTSVCLNWASEAARFAPTLNVKMFGTGDRAGTLSNAGAFDLVIASYGLLQQDAERFAGVHWHTIVLDEAQAIKNGATKRSQAVMALRGDFRMVATGTPLENHLGELWNLFRFINPGLLGSIEQFNLRFAGPIEKQQDHRAEVGARQRLRRLIGPFILRRTKTQVLKELPSRTEIVLEVDLSQQEKELYESLRREALESLAQVEGPPEKKSIQILAEIMKLRRACCNPNLVAPGLNLASSKLAAFAHLLEGLLENRHKVLVFSQFVDHLTLIRAHLDRNGIAYQYLDGATPMAARKQRVDAFQAGEGDVFLISLKAGGMGINLTAADYVIHMDPWWNPAVEDQASDRAHRMGQLRPVTIYRLVARHTIEEGIVDLHQHKRDLADSLLDGSDMSARMSSQEMLAMLQEGLR